MCAGECVSDEPMVISLDYFYCADTCMYRYIKEKDEREREREERVMDC